jgi:hypothetical protein
MREVTSDDKTLFENLLRRGMFYGLDDWGSVPGKGDDGIFSLRHLFQAGSGAHPASYPVGTRDLSPAVKLTIHLHMVPRLRMDGSVFPLLQYILMTWCVIKDWNTFTFITREEAAWET